MLAVTDMVLEQNASLLRQGAVLVDTADESDLPWLLFLLTHEVKSGDGAVLSKRMQFIRVNPDGSASFAGWAPHLDLEPLSAADRAPQGSSRGVVEPPAVHRVASESHMASITLALRLGRHLWPRWSGSCEVVAER